MTQSSRTVLYGAGIALLALACVVRLLSYPFFTSDYTYFFLPWYEALRAPGLSAFIQPFADYAPLYLYLVKLLTFIHAYPLILVKALSLAFDIVIAVTFALFVRRSALPAGAPFLAGAVAFALPTVMANSTFWGQADAVYGAFVLLTAYAIVLAAPLWAAILFGLALAAKAQAIFFLPVFAGWLLRRRALARYVWIPPLVFLVTVIPAWLAGGNLWYWLFVYAHQAGEYPWLSVSAQSVFAFVQPLHISAALTNVLFWAGIGAGLLISAALALYTAMVPRLSIRTLVLISLASTLLLPYVLPRMHERYFYLADLFATLYAFFAPNRWWVAMIVVLCSLISYVPFLSGQIGFLHGIPMDLRVPAALLLVPVGLVIYDLVRAWKAPASVENEAEAARHAV
jgi:Gpi18-like mannosyltransferase